MPVHLDDVRARQALEQAALVVEIDGRGHLERSVGDAAGARYTTERLHGR